MPEVMATVPSMQRKSKKRASEISLNYLQRVESIARLLSIQ
jgi:hypothetical protein